MSVNSNSSDSVITVAEGARPIDTGEIHFRNGREFEWRLHKYAGQMFEEISEWLANCNHSPESNCIHQRRAQKVLDRIRDFKP